MKKINIYVFSEYYYDIRIKKKAISLSKKFIVNVICIIPNNKLKVKEKINKNLLIKRYFISKFRFNTRFIFNKLLLKPIIIKNPSEIVDCNDPDTIFAGVYSKKLYGSKIIYDSHELWRYSFAKRKSIIRTIYNYIYTKSVFSLEKKYINDFDEIITVSEYIKYFLYYHYKINNINVIYNYQNYNSQKPKPFNQRKKQIIFVGRYRLGVEEILDNIYLKTGLEPVIVGFKGNFKNIDYKGFITENEMKDILNKCFLGFVYYNVNNYSMLLTSTNKIHFYIQNNLPFIAIDGPHNRDIVQNYKVGELYNFFNENELINKLNKLKNYNIYNNYLKNIKKYKKQLSWEAQEKQLFEIYEFD